MPLFWCWQKKKVYPQKLGINQQNESQNLHKNRSLDKLLKKLPQSSVGINARKHYDK
jgi:hypothetical protein